ncbi:MAG: alpha-ribazole phosphatase [Patescibacteria group bacterium]|nr:MAG: alpha-ribazole phosphatase [Phototrophicales bacterium]GIW60610.1 MAG: alpha-ribazole phosphatase [Patescibacteria group bacterium]
MSTKILLVRHGETDWNVIHRFQGSSDVPLNDTGREQAQKLALRLSSETFDAIYSSDLLRAAETAQIIAQQPIIYDARLREIHFGVFEGLTFTEIMEQYPHEWDLWRKRQAPPPEGEEIADVATRVQVFLEDILTQHSEQKILIVTHGGIIGMIATQLLNHPPHKIWQFRFDNTSITEFGFYPQGIVLVRLNDVCHLTQC